MAGRYWVGGSGTWDLVSTTNWSASPGGAGGASVPTLADDVYFDRTGTYTVTITASISAKDLTVSAGVVTLNSTSTSSNLTFYGSVTLLSNTVFTSQGSITFQNTVVGSTTVINFAGVTLGGNTIYGCVFAPSFGATIALGSAFTTGKYTYVGGITAGSGVFDTAGYALNINDFLFSSGFPTVKLRSSTVTASTYGFSGTVPIFLEAGTSIINLQGGIVSPRLGSSVIPLTFNEVRINGGNASFTVNFPGEVTLNNLTFSNKSTSGLRRLQLASSLTITGTLSVGTPSNYSCRTMISGYYASASTPIYQRTITASSVPTLTAVDFQDINIAGTGWSGTSIGDCGNNSNITFTAPKTVYWGTTSGFSFAGGTTWATSIGGAVAANNYPLPQDTAVFPSGFPNSGQTINLYGGSASTYINIPSIDASARTANTLVLNTGSSSFSLCFGDVTLGSGCSYTGSTYNPFSKRGTQTLTANGATYGTQLIVVNNGTTLLLGSAVATGGSINTSDNSTFDASGYSVTATTLSAGTTSGNVRMGSGAWTLTGTGTVWQVGSSLVSGSATITLSNNTTTARSFTAGLNNYYAKIIIGGNTSTSTTTLNSGAAYGEIASTKTVAHTIAFGTSVTFGKWSVTGTAGNVVTITGSNVNTVVGPAVTGVDYLAMGTWGLSTTSPGEFYAGANSTGTAAAPVFRTVAPAPRNLYWVGGTGNWSSTTKWSTSSGGASGAAIPTSLDSVTFDSASNATAYTATIDAGVTIARCAAFTMNGPASGNVTFAGTVQIAYHGNVSFSATGITRTYTGNMNLAGNSSSTFTTNGLTLSNATTVTGIGATWTLGSDLNIGGGVNLTVTYGTFDTSSSGNYTLTTAGLSSSNRNVRGLNLNASTVDLFSSSTAWNMTTSTNATLNAGTSTINLSNPSAGFTGGGLTYYNVSFTSTSLASPSITGANTFNNLSITGRTSTGIGVLSLSADQTINGTFTVSAGTAAAYRVAVFSNTLGTTRTLTCAAVSLTDTDFRDITIAGAASPASGTRLGDCKGNSGITFDAAKTVYYGQTGSANWGATGSGSWSATSGGALDATQFPLAQDTAIFPAATYPASGSTTTINAAYNIGTIDMSLRTSNTMTLAAGTIAPFIYGSWINGTGTTNSGTGIITFAGRTTQQLTGAGRPLSQPLIFNSPGGSIVLQSAFSASSTTTLTGGTLNLNGYTYTSASNFLTATGGTSPVVTAKNITFNGGTLACAVSGSTAFNNASPTNFTTTAGTGVGTISMTSVSAKTFVPGATGFAYTTYNCTLNQGGAGALTISGQTTLFNNITNTVQPASVLFTAGVSYAYFFNSFNLSGTAGNLITIDSVTASRHLLRTAATVSVSYCTINDSLASAATGGSWTALTSNGNVDGGNNIGWVFAASAIYDVYIAEAASGVDSVVGYVSFYSAVQEFSSGVDQVDATLTYLGVITETGSGVDSASASFTVNANASEAASGIDSVSSSASLGSSVSETASGLDAISSAQVFPTNISETGSGIDQIDAAQTFATNVDEAGSGIDQVDASQEFLSSISETGSGLDQVDTNFTVNSNASETASGVEEVFSAATFATDIAESGSGVDETSALQTFTTDIAESASGLDQADAAQTFVTNVAESGSGIDQIDASQDFSSNIFEAGSGVDQVDTNFTVNSDVLETVSGVDSSSSVAVFLTDVNETASGIDSVSSAQTFVTDVSEAGSGIDQIDAAQSFVSSVSETASGQDEDSVAASTFNAYAEETASGVDSDSVAASTFNAYSDESASGLDDINANQVFGSAVVEEASGVDNISAAQSFATSVSEAGSGIDQVDSTQSFSSSITETASGVDSDSVADSIFNAYADESASGVDAASSNASFGSAINENASGVDAISSAQTFVTNITETASGLDAPSVAASIFNATLSETASGLDVISSNPIFGASIAESASGVDSIFSSATFVSNIAETASGVDSISVAQGFAVLIDENASGLDAFTVAASIFNAAFTDSASGIDALQPNFTYFITVPEGVSALDQIIGGYLWNPVDDTQNPNWGNVSNTQAAGWAAVDDTQTINWQNVNNTNAPGWASVDGTQSPSWTDVQTH